MEKTFAEIENERLKRQLAIVKQVAMGNVVNLERTSDEWSEAYSEVYRIQKESRERDLATYTDAPSIIESIKRQIDDIRRHNGEPICIMMRSDQREALEQHVPVTTSMETCVRVNILGPLETCLFNGLPVRTYDAGSRLLPVIVLTSLELMSFQDMWNRLSETVHAIAKEKGWWGTGNTEAMLIILQKLNVAINNGEHYSVIAKLEEEFRSHTGNRPVSENLALITSEVSEHLEAMRHGNPQSDKIPFSNAEEEAADVIIREMDLATRENWDIPGAILSKIHMNAGRKFKHGGKRF